jgi:hypothetical protein
MAEYSIITDILPLSLADAVMSMEADRQKEILLVRKYYGGDQGVELTDRLKQFLGDENRDGPSFRVNLIKAVIDIELEKLHVKSFDCVDTAQAKLAWQWWTKNQMDAVQEDVYEAGLRDGESFIVIDWDDNKQSPQWIMNPRWTDTINGGDDFGCWMSYPNNDPNQEPSFAVKQWVETTSRDRVEHRNVYFPDRIMKYTRGGNNADWVLIGTVDWTDESGEPIGIPVIVFQTRGLRSEVWDALPMEDVVNKSTLDLIATLDMTAFRIFYAFGFIPTDDGKEPADDGSNWLKVAPGQIVGTTKTKTDVDFGAIEAADPEPLLKAVHQFMLWLAMLSGTPTSRFTTSGVVAKDETLKEQERPLAAKILSHQIRFGNSWERVLEVSRRLYNSKIVGEPVLDVEPMFETLWADAGTQSEADRVEMLVMKRELGIPLSQLWSEAGYSREQIEEMQKTEEYTRMLNTLGPMPGSEQPAAPADNTQGGRDGQSGTEQAQESSGQQQQPTA